VNLRVEQRLAAFADRVRTFATGPAGKKDWRRGKPR
jgi:hypothetical protein